MEIIANVDYIYGYLRYGHYELKLDDEESNYYKKLSEKEKMEYIEDNGELVVDDYRVEDVGTITEIIEND